MLFDLPTPLQEYFQKVFSAEPMKRAVHRLYVEASVCAILLCTGRLTMEKIGKILPDFQRTKAAISNIFKSKNFSTKAVAMQSALMLCKKVYRQNREKDAPWVLILDTTHRSRFGKQLENLIANHGEKSKKRSYAFVWPLLLTPSGVRISFPCPVWRTPNYSKQCKLKHKTQPQLAAEFIKTLAKELKRLKIDIEIVLVADSAFECKALWDTCNKAKWTFITSCSAQRCLGFKGKKASRKYDQKVCELMSTVDTGSPTQINIFSLTKIRLRSLMKPHCKRSNVVSHLYAYCQNIVDISMIGKTNVVRSCKLKKHSQLLSEAPEKVLLCNNLDFSPEQVIAYYTLRWQIETFFREQKSDLPFTQFQAYESSACWKFVHLLTIAFNFLEFYRLRYHSSSLHLRTRFLNSHFRSFAFFESFDWLIQRSQTLFGIQRAKRAFKTLGFSKQTYIPLLS